MLFVDLPWRQAEGVANQARLQRAFKRPLAMTPGHYRDAHR